MDWTAFGAVATACTGLFVLISVLILAWQIRELRRSASAQAYTTVIARLQGEDTRMARATLFGLAGKDIAEWMKDELKAAEKVCQSYDSIAIMVRNRWLPKHVLLSNWRDSLARSWKAAMPLVEKYRTERNAPETWDDFQWLAVQAQKLKAKQAQRK